MHLVDQEKRDLTNRTGHSLFSPSISETRVRLEYGEMEPREWKKQRKKETHWKTLINFPPSLEI